MRPIAIDDRPPNRLSTARSLGIGLELGASLGGMALLGWFLDRQFATGPWLTLTCVLAGLVGGVYNAIRAVGRLTRRDE